MGKRVTKKLVREALESFTSWSFAYDFKVNYKIILFFSPNEEGMIAALAKHGIVVTEHDPYKRETARTGSMRLAMAESATDKAANWRNITAEGGGGVEW